MTTAQRLIAALEKYPPVGSPLFTPEHELILSRTDKTSPILVKRVSVATIHEIALIAAAAAAHWRMKCDFDSPPLYHSEDDKEFAESLRALHEFQSIYESSAKEASQ